MKRLVNKKEFKSFFIFFLTGVFGASVNFLSQIPFKSWLLDIGLKEAQALAWSLFFAYSLASAVSFLPAKAFAFSEHSNGNTRREWIKFFLIAFLALGVQELITFWALGAVENTYLSHYGLFYKEKAAHLVGMSFSFVANFLGHRFFHLGLQDYMSDYGLRKNIVYREFKKNLKN
jgi:putative flippase GtrA